MPESSPQSPAEQGSSADWRAQAAAAKLPVFPIRIFQDGAGKWCKEPITKHGHLDAGYDVDRFDWRRANGFGIRCGEVATGVGFYLIDIDLHRTEDGGAAAWRWLAEHEVPLDTREHRTVSGGVHLFYSLPGGHLTLPSRSNVDAVLGLDTRGEGGWAAFGAGYTRVRDVAPVTLPRAVCEALQAGWKGGIGHNGGPGLGVEIPELHPVDRTAVMLRLADLLTAVHPTRSLCRAWAGTRSQGDLSRSGYDHATACNLALCGFNHSEIVFLLLREFPHGVAARDGETPRTLRALTRSAAKAVAYVKWLHAEPRKPSKEEAEAAAEEYLRMLLEEEEGRA